MLFSILAACSFGDESKNGLEDSSESQTSELIPENGRNVLLHDDVERSYRLHVPGNVAEGAPLVVVMHGYSSSASVIEEYSEMNRIADENGFVVVCTHKAQQMMGDTIFSMSGMTSILRLK